MKSQLTTATVPYTLGTLPDDALLHALARCSASTLVRASMACRALRTAAERAARARARELELELPDEVDEDDPSWKQAAQRPLAAVFKEELASLLWRHRSTGWQHTAPFLWFRLTEADLDWEVSRRGGVGMLVYDGADTVDWLQEVETDDLIHRTAYDESEVDLDALGLREHETVWHDAHEAFYVFTCHLVLHKRWGRPGVTVQELFAMEGHGWEYGLVRDLRQWHHDAEPSERGRFDADVRAGLDAAVILTRFTRSAFPYKLRYGGHDNRIGSWEIECLLRLVPPPAWQRRPSSFELRLWGDFYHVLFDDIEEALDPYGGHPVRFKRHVAIGDRRDVWFRCTLAFYDAIERLGIVKCGM